MYLLIPEVTSDESSILNQFVCAENVGNQMAALKNVCISFIIIYIIIYFYNPVLQTDSSPLVHLGLICG